MRNIMDVIKQVEDILPEGDELKKDLKTLRYSASFTAPEAMRMRWEEFQSLLIHRFSGEMHTPLAIQVADIFGDKK